MGTTEGGFLAGDVVLHRNWGVGRVLEVGSGNQAEIVVDFANKPKHHMSSQVAKHSLSKLPSNGLEALLLKEREVVARWSNDAPLKLIGAALADIGKAAKPAELKAKINGHQLLPVKWESWWKRVQPLLKQSSCFWVRSDGSYELVSELKQIPAEPLPSILKKARETRVTKPKVLEIVSKLEVGEMKFEDLQGARTRRAVAREIVRRTKVSELARSTVIRALEGPALPARLILQELAKSSHPEVLIEALVELTRHLQQLATAPATEKGKKTGEHIIAKLHILEGAATMVATHGQLEGKRHIIVNLVDELLSLALLLWRRGISDWRSKSLECISNVLARLAEKEPDVFAFAGEHLAKYNGNTSAKVATVDNILTKVKPDARYEAADKLMMSSLVGAPEFIQECFIRYVKKEQRLSWVSSALSRVLGSFDVVAIESLARLLVRINSELHPQESGAFVDLAITVASISPKAGAALSPVIEDKLKERLSSLPSESEDRGALPKASIVLAAIEHSLRTELEKERQEAKGTYERLQSEIKGLRSKSARLEEIVEQLQSGYHLPEQWLMFQAKRDVLQGLTELYQEAFLATGGDEDTMVSWMLQRLGNILQRYGVSYFGKVESCVKYNPELHEFIRGFETGSNDVRIKCPGCEWQDPAGKKVILARARVTGLQGGRNGLQIGH